MVIKCKERFLPPDPFLGVHPLQRTWQDLAHYFPRPLILWVCTPSIPRLLGHNALDPLFSPLPWLSRHSYRVPVPLSLALSEQTLFPCLGFVWCILNQSAFVAKEKSESSCIYMTEKSGTFFSEKSGTFFRKNPVHFFRKSPFHFFGEIPYIFSEKSVSFFTTQKSFFLSFQEGWMSMEEGM